MTPQQLAHGVPTSEAVRLGAQTPSPDRGNFSPLALVAQRIEQACAKGPVVSSTLTERTIRRVSAPEQL